jgi:hypothetical protein
VHLSWDVATLHLCFKDFAWLAAVVEEAVGRGSPDLPLVLWVGSVALRMSHAEGIELRGMIRTALVELGQARLEPSQARPFVRLPN